MINYNWDTTSVDVANEFIIVFKEAHVSIVKVVLVLILTFTFFEKQASMCELS